MKRSTSQRDRDREAIRRTGAACGICGEAIDYSLPYLHPMSFVVDHVIPVKHGGRDELSNKVASHRACNRAKGDRLDGGPVLRHSRSLRRPTTSK